MSQNIFFCGILHNTYHQSYVTSRLCSGAFHIFIVFMMVMISCGLIFVLMEHGTGLAITRSIWDDPSICSTNHNFFCGINNTQYNLSDLTSLSRVALLHCVFWKYFLGFDLGMDVTWYRISNN